MLRTLARLPGGKTLGTAARGKRYGSPSEPSAVDKLLGNYQTQLLAFTLAVSAGRRAAKVKAESCV